MDASVGGGPFMDGCVHNWDYANLVFGKALEAVGSLMRLGPGSALDTGCVTVRYEGGDEVALCWSWGLPSGARGCGASDILGPRGVIRFPGSFPESELPGGFDAERRGAYLLDNGSRRRIVPFVKRDMFAQEWRDFHRSVTRGVAPRATGEQAREAVAVALTVLRAGGTRRAVRMP